MILSTVLSNIWGYIYEPPVLRVTSQLTWIAIIPQKKFE